MFGNLKKKLKGFFSKAAEEVEVEEEVIEAPIEEIVEVVEAPIEEVAEEEPELAPVEEITEVEKEILEEVAEEIKEEEPAVEPEKVEELEPVKETSEPEVVEPVEREVVEKPEPIVEEAKPDSIEEEEEPETAIEETVKPIKEEKPKKGLLKRIFTKKEPKPATPSIPVKPDAAKPSLLKRLTKKHISETALDKVLWELEIALLENDVAKEVTEKITEDTKTHLLNQPVSARSAEEEIEHAVKTSIENILRKEKVDVLQRIKEKSEKPFVIMFFGFNGTGKTLTIGKFAKLLKDQGLSVVLAAGDTFRAAAIEQLEEHAKKLEVPIIKQPRGSDAAAVIFDAIAHAKAKGIDVVLADTAGRSEVNRNLMDELKKLVRVNSPDLKIFVGDALTGNDAADQAKGFDDAVGIDASILNKVDCDAKGGACLSVSYVTDKPIIYFGTGQGYADMEPFDPEWFVKKIF